MKYNRRTTIALLAAVGLVVFVISALTPTQVKAQEDQQANLMYACYMPNSGVVYRINPPDDPGQDPKLKDDCRSKRHVKFYWVDIANGHWILADGVTSTTGGFAVTGTLNLNDPGPLPVSGYGTRLMWYPSLAAFRAGATGADQWDLPNIGPMSVALGEGPTAEGRASVAMGLGSTASEESATAMGDYTTASGFASTAMGAQTTASGVASTAIGNHTTASGTVSTAMGSFASTDGKSGSFVYGDGSGVGSPSSPVVRSPTEKSFTVRASGGVYLYTNPTLTSGMILPNGGSGWDAVSDRNLKENFQHEDGEHALTSIAAMPIQSWNYKTQDPSIRHMGPMAQDFYAAFGLGTDDKHINTVDIDGVNMLAVQALEKRTSDLRAENEQLRARIADLEAAILRLETAITGGNK
jgi:hypothetical protein